MRHSWLLAAKLHRYDTAINIHKALSFPLVPVPLTMATCDGMRRKTAKSKLCSGAMKSLIVTQNCDKYIGLVKSTFLILQDLFVQFQRYQTPSAILLYRYLTNVSRGRIEYEPIYSLRGARHRAAYSVHIR